MHNRLLLEEQITFSASNGVVTAVSGILGAGALSFFHRTSPLNLSHLTTPVANFMGGYCATNLIHLAKYVYMDLYGSRSSYANTSKFLTIYGVLCSAFLAAAICQVVYQSPVTDTAMSVMIGRGFLEMAVYLYEHRAAFNIDRLTPSL